MNYRKYNVLDKNKIILYYHIRFIEDTSILVITHKSIYHSKKLHIFC